MKRGDSQVVTVLHSLAPPSGETRYVVQLVEGAPEDLHLEFFTWRNALVGRFDVFHIHWPEYLIRDRKPLKAFARKIAMLALLARLQITRRPLVRTLHNVHPHERGGRLESWLLRLIDQRTDIFIRLNPVTEAPLGSVSVETILHGHYRDKYGDKSVPSTVPGRLLYFGLIRPYKGVERLLEVFESDTDLSSLRVVGSPSSLEFRELVSNASERDNRISSIMRFVEDEVLAAEIGEAELVVLPYTAIHNSGSVLLALSLDRPVLVPAAESTIALQDEVGSDWLLTYEGELTSRTITSALEAVRSHSDRGRPALAGRDWDVVGESHLRVYRDAISRKRGRN